MLECLFGNRNIQRILIFLFVNGKCYGTQLHRSLMTPLTPLQKALQRLEKGSLIVSHYEGKTRLYQINPAYPLRQELEQLLKKAYTLLPAAEKKDYYVAKEDRQMSALPQEYKMRVLLACWDKLMKVSQLHFQAKTQAQEATGWNGQGSGEVIVTKEGKVITFQEKGKWQSPQGGDVSFSNVFRWTLDRYAGVIALEHLRRGPDHPVFLFHLVPHSSHSLISVDSHLCEGDTYFGQVQFDAHALKLHWRVIGPKKNENIDYYYS